MNVLKLGPDNIVTGVDALDYLGTQSSQFKRALIVMGKGSLVRNGSLQKLQNILAQNNVVTEVFTGVEADPTFATVMRGAEKAREFQPDVIIGFGGGSAMDAAKVIQIFYENPECSTLDSILLPNIIPRLGESCKLICIPTTAGTGSEATSAAVITDETTHIKHAVVDPKFRMVPSLALLCPEFTVSMPSKVTAASGLDAITHSIEAFVAVNANPYSDAFSARAFKDAYQCLPYACANGKNLEYRERMLTASCMAGIAFTNSSLGMVHSIAHALGGYLGIAHGIACATALPVAIGYNRQDEITARKYQELANSVNSNTLQDAVLDLCNTLGLETGLKGFFENKKAFDDAVPKLAQIAAADMCHFSNPVPVTVDAFGKLITSMYE